MVIDVVHRDRERDPSPQLVQVGPDIAAVGGERVDELEVVACCVVACADERSGAQERDPVVVVSVEALDEEDGNAADVVEVVRRGPRLESPRRAR